MSDPIEELIKQIQTDTAIISTHFTSSRLNLVGEVFERDGFGATRLYLLEKQDRDGSDPQATALLKVLDLMGDCPAIKQRRALGRALFKVLGALRPAAKPGTPRGVRL
jgi:hypothetical protein